MISFQNGVSNAETLRRLLPKHASCRAWCPTMSSALGPGRWHRATWGDLTAEDHAVTRALAARIGDRPGRLRLAADMTASPGASCSINLNNAINALSGLTILEELKQRDYRRVFAAAIDRDAGAARRGRDRAGQDRPDRPDSCCRTCIGAPDFIFRNMFLKVQKIDPKGRGSMADDFAAGRPTEIDYLNGEVVRLAARSAARRRSTRRSSRWSSRPRRASSGSGAPRSCAPTSSAAIAARRLRILNARIFV